MLMTSGVSTSKTSGSILVRSADAGSGGTSGPVTLTTGRSNLGTTGQISISTGDATGGSAGDISLEVGTGHEYRGGDIKIQSGGTREADAPGGSIHFATGFSEKRSSGAFSVRTSDAGKIGASGFISLNTGMTTQGDSGSFAMGTGDAKKGRGGDFRIKIGTSTMDGGGIYMNAGEATARGQTGGNIAIGAGEGSNAHRWEGGKGGSISLYGGAAKGMFDRASHGGDGENLVSIARCYLLCGLLLMPLSRLIIFQSFAQIFNGL